MQKSSNKLTKENKELRRQLEILKAQSKTETKSVKANSSFNPKIEVAHEVKNPTISGSVVSTQYVKRDLLRTIILSGIVFSIIIGIYISGKFS